ncbi:MAG: signal peptide peptidase SppA [Paramuribaculum sp.]|nr:signal peptide peptidase SppA [Paramuribaculum sp.]
MKKFLYSFLGTVAGIWISVFLGFILLFFTIGVIATSSGSKNAPVKVKDDSVLKITLGGTVVDRETPVNLMEQLYSNAEKAVALTDIVDAIYEAKDDNRIKGIYLECEGANMGLAQAQAIIKALSDFRKSGKWVYSYADSYTQTDYYVASVADSVFINPIGMLDIHGLSATTMFYKGLMEKLGIEAQVVKVGTYKSAVEPFLLSGMSDANREQQELFLGSIWDYVRNKIATNRNIKADSINIIADSFTFTKQADYYLKHGLVDGLKYRHQMSTVLASETGKADDPDFIAFDDYVSLSKSPLLNKSGKGSKIAVLYAVGDIVDSGSEGISASAIVPEIMKIAKDETVDGLILRVNSGGGSAFASEQIWEAFEQFKKLCPKKPFYVSMGDMAASGGYYISCGANRIYAEPVTLTGSIGIFGIIPNLQPLMKEKLGVNVETVQTNSGSFPTLLQPMTDGQKAAMQSYVNNGYELFVARCAAGRHKTVAQIKAVAEGRVWDGQTALKHGLVDKLGGLDMAINDMAAEIGAEDYFTENYPEVKVKWWEMLLDMDSELSAAISDSDAATMRQATRAYRAIRDMSSLQCRTNYIKIR